MFNPIVNGFHSNFLVQLIGNKSADLKTWHLDIAIVLFKAQLFVPYQQQVDFEILNVDCICGFYINTSQLELFKTYQFYIPIKLDWFLAPKKSVDWLSFSKFKTTTKSFTDGNKSPLIWMKSNTGLLSKAFLVWW